MKTLKITMTNEQKRIMVIAAKIIELVNLYYDTTWVDDGLTNSDMQGMAEAIAMEAVRGTK